MAEDRIDGVEIEPLADQELEGVAGGATVPGTSTGPTCCSCQHCSCTDPP